MHLLVHITSSLLNNTDATFDFNNVLLNIEIKINECLE